ncbi:MAG: hypothetical protein D6705_17580 [Deltaproteobacteria bacterium]|nr:MAG: hypothetical protein D6705_17580 [Deltaproteobacteria bacterium]
MLRTRTLLSLCLSVAAAAAVLSPDTAHARKKGVLEGEPIVRKKLLLRKLRFQMTPVIGMSLSQPFVHEGYAGLRLGFHATEWLGFRAGFMWGAVQLKSKVLKDLEDGGLPVGIPAGQQDTSVTMGPTCQGPAPCRPIAENDNPAPLLHDFQAGLTHALWQSSVDIVFTPFNGKLGLFSAIFTEYDAYVFGGLGIMGWQKFYNGKFHRDEIKSTAELNGLDTNPEVDGMPNPNYCREMNGAQNDECILHPVKPDERVHLGFSFGGGFNLFVADWGAINVEVQDIVTRNNLTGLNATIDDVVKEGGPVVNKRDLDFFHNVTLQLGFRVYIPFKAKRGR